MDKEELAAKLYQTMQTEYTDYLEQVEKMSPEDIIQQAYGIVTRADILMLFEDERLTDTLTKGQLETACHLSSPLEWLYQSWLKVETNYMEELGDCLSETLKDYEKSFLDKSLHGPCKQKSKDNVSQEPVR